MDLKQLQKMIDEEPQPAAPETVKEVVEMEQTEEKKPTTPEQAPEDQQPTTPTAAPVVSAAQFGAVLTSIYCGISDAVYKKIKNCKTAPAWEPETRQVINEAAAAALSNYNVPMSPVWQLVITLATVEVMRYTLLKPE